MPLSPVDFDMNMAGVDNAVSFTSYTYDVVLDLYFAQARFYDANSRRFISVDPIKDGVNWYAYCGNNPVVFVDPSGLDAYIFYGKDQEKAAKNDAKELKKRYGTVHLIFADTDSDFLTGWQSMGNVDGNAVSIDLVEINLHGNATSIYSSDGTEIDLTQMQSQDIATILLLSCNGGHLDYSNNVATQLLNGNNVQDVIAGDGTVWYSRFLGKTSYYAKGDDSWKNQKQSQNFNSCRNNNGFVVFSQDGSTTNLGFGSWFASETVSGILKEAEAKYDE